MDIVLAFVLILTIIPAASYGWGMRGTTIGGEKGAMLPGALIGGLLAIFSGIFIVQEHFYIFSALGAIAMYFGGCMTYGETLSISISARPAVDLKKGLTSLFVKGFLWFAVFGAIFSTGVNAVSKVYSILELIIIFILTPSMAIIGLNKLNRPHNVQEVKFPKIYFSKTRKEYWGAMVGIVFALTIINIIKLNAYSLLFTLICGIFGGLGWLCGQGVQIYIKHYGKTSDFKIINKFVNDKYFECWKAMECTFGAVGGLGCAIAFILTYPLFKEVVFTLELNGGIVPYNSIVADIFFYLWLLLLIIDMGHYFIKPPLSIEELKDLHTKGKISDKKFSSKILNAKINTDEFSKKFNKFWETYEFIAYASIPFILICLGSVKTVKIMSFFMLYWVLAQEIGFENKYTKLKSYIIKITFSVVGLIILLTQIMLNIEAPAFSTFLLYTVIYEVLTLSWLLPSIVKKNSKKNTEINLNDNKLKRFLTQIKENKSFVIIHLYFVVCIIITLSNIK